MSLKTRFGNLKNVLDEKQQPDRNPGAGARSLRMPSLA